MLDLDLEHRFVVADGKVVTGSPYLIAGAGYHPAMASPRFADAEAYARRVVSALGTECPPAMCLDVGWDRGSGRWVIVEANSLWSSGMYGCDAQAFTLGVEVANSAGDGRWAWTPESTSVNEPRASRSCGPCLRTRRRPGCRSADRADARVSQQRGPSVVAHRARRVDQTSLASWCVPLAGADAPAPAA